MQLLVAIPAVVFLASEYTSGSARVTFLAVPTRIPVLLGKQLAVAVPAAVAGVAGAGIAFGGNALLDAHPEVWAAVRAVAGAGLYLAAIAALSVAVAAIIRSLVGATLTVAALLTVAPLIVTLIPIDWVQRTAAWLPTPAGQLVFLPDNPDASLSWWGGYLVLLAWTAGATFIAGVLLRARDV
ncbi:ABC transporter permease subunit [Microbacterium lacticum]